MKTMQPNVVSNGTARQRLHRERERNGLAVLPVLVDLVAVEAMLIDLGFVSDDPSKQELAEGLAAGCPIRQRCHPLHRHPLARRMMRRYRASLTPCGGCPRRELERHDPDPSGTSRKDLRPVKSSMI